MLPNILVVIRIKFDAQKAKHEPAAKLPISKIREMYIRTCTPRRYCVVVVAARNLRKENATTMVPMEVAAGGRKLRAHQTLEASARVVL